VVGCTTFSDDFIGRASRGIELPLLREGDILAITDCGGYGFAMASNFLNKPKPAEVIINNNGDLKLSRRAETYEDLLRMFVLLTV
jgi:diaminopimelate decarboxylase